MELIDKVRNALVGVNTVQVQGKESTTTYSWHGAPNHRWVRDPVEITRDVYTTEALAALLCGIPHKSEAYGTILVVTVIDTSKKINPFFL